MIVGPVGVQEYLNKTFELSATYITYPLKVIELESGKNRDLGTICGQSVAAYPLTHKVASFGYVITEPDKKGKIDAARAKELGIVGKDLGRISKGEDITLSNGTVIHAADLIGETRRGRKFVFLGDTSNSDSLLDAGRDCTFLIHEVINIIMIVHSQVRQHTMQTWKQKPSKEVTAQGSEISS